MGSRGKSGDHKRKSESVFASRGQHSRCRVQAREDLELEPSQQSLGTRPPERKRRKRRVDKRRSGEEGTERCERKGKGGHNRKGAAKRTEDRGTASHVVCPAAEVLGGLKTQDTLQAPASLRKEVAQHESQLGSRQFKGSLPGGQNLVAGSSQDSVVPRATVLPQQDRRGANDSFLESNLSSAGVFLKRFVLVWVGLHVCRLTRTSRKVCPNMLVWSLLNLLRHDALTNNFCRPAWLAIASVRLQVMRVVVLQGDLHKETPPLHVSPLKLFPFRASSHYS